MKKKVLSLLLAVCLIVGMLPLAASAAPGEPVENVSAAILHDPTGGVADDKLYDAGSYNVNAIEVESGIVNVQIAALNLQKHAMGGEGALIAYWAGFAVVPPEEQRDSVKMMQVGSGNTPEEASEAFDNAEPTELWGAVDGVNDGFAAYINAGSINNRVYKVQFLDEAGEAIEGLDPVVYNVSLTGILLAPETEVLPGYLHDTREEGGLDELYTSYDVTSEQKLDVNYGGYYTEVSVAAKDLKEHQNGENKMGYWAGMFAKAPKGATQYKYAFGTSYSDLKTLSEGASPVDEMPNPAGEGNVQGIGAYANIGEPGYKTWLKVQWLDESGKALNTTVYHMDFSNSTVSSDAEAPKYTSEIATGVLEDHSGAVAKDQIATGYTLTKGEMVKDTVTGKYYQEVTVSADTLKPQENTQDTVGYWLGFAVAPASAEVTQMKYGFASSLSGLSLSSENPLEGAVIGDKSGIAFYANMSENTRTLWARVQWLKADDAVAEENIYKINFQVNTKETVGIKDIAVYESDAISDAVTAALGEDGKTITLSGVAPESETTYTLKYTTTAGGAGSTTVTYNSGITAGGTFKVLDTEYTVVAAFADMPANVDVIAPAVPSVNAPEGTEENLTDAAASVKVGAMSAAAVEAAQGLDPENAELKADAVAALKAKGVTVNDSDPIYYYVQPYLDIKVDNDSYVESADGKALTLDINPMYRVVVSTQNTFGGDLEQDQNAALLTGYEGPLTVTNAEVYVDLPTGFTAENSIYVKHHEHYHLATVAADKATFTTESFSEFTFDTSAKPVASIGDTYYATLQEAVDAVENGGVINVLTAGLTATVSREIAFKTTGEIATINAGTGYENQGTGTEYKFVTVGGGSTGGGGTGSTGYTVTVSATQNGTVTASPSSANKGDKVTLTVAPAEGYELGALTVKDASGKTVSTTKVSENEYTFTMPEGNVTVTATFVEKNATPFTDVKTTDWWYEAVKYVYENKLMSGTSDTTFEPTAKLNRAQAVQILYNLEGQPAVTGTADFTDVSGHWALNAITWGAKNGVVAGVGNGKFDPNANVTREQFAQMMYNYAKFKGYDLTAQGDLDNFTDVSKVSDWAETALAWANGEGLINGNTDGTLAPNGTAIRGQAASIMAKFDQNVAEE